jgi:dihydroorotate dehydrogenase
MYPFVRALLFLFPPEWIHELSFKAIRLFFRLPFSRALTRSLAKSRQGLATSFAGLTFPAPVGLAAGFDKNAVLTDELAYLGFGFIEIGTVTPKPQAGNPKPRLFRLKKDRALINRMGFNNDGVAAIRHRLAHSKPGVPIGGNIGKNKDTPNEQAFEDYRICFEELYPFVDYFVVNVSSPNTPNLRALQEKGPLTELLQRLEGLRKRQPLRKPMLLKIAPDLTDTQLDDIIEIVQATQMDGIIATNTTLNRGGLQTAQGEIHQIGAGGLSGAPLKDRATEVIRYIHEKSGGKIPIIGVGGIFSPADALEKLNAGATLVQMYTGFVYQGPGVVAKINQAIRQAYVR